MVGESNSAFLDNFGSSDEFPTEEYIEYSNIQNYLISQTNILAAKAYKKNLSVGGLGYCLYMCSHPNDAFSIDVYNRWFEIIDKMIDDNRIIDCFSVFAFMIIELQFELEQIPSEEFETKEVLLSTLTPFMSIVDKISLDKTVSNLDYDNMLIYPLTQLIYWMQIMFKNMSNLEVLKTISTIDIDEFTTTYGKTPYEYYLENEGLKTFDAIAKMENQNYLTAELFNVLSGNVDSSFMIKDGSKATPTNWWMIRRDILDF